MPSFFDTAIIGAGLAGLSCAHELRTAGHAVHIFDKSRGVGGRMSTRREEAGVWDHGAQYFTARTPEFTAQVLRWIADGVLTEWQPRLVVIPPSTRGSAAGTRRYVGVPGMTAPARYLAASLPVQLQRTITALRRDGAAWQVHSTEHGWHQEHYANVVLAMPAPQAAALLQAVAPELSTYAGAASMTPCWAAMLEYQSDPGLPFDAAFINQGPLRWVARNTSKPGRGAKHCWVLHASEDWSAAHEEDSAGSVMHTLLEAFAEIGAPAPTSARVHRWRYANIPDTDTTAPGMLWRADLGLGLCGDWLHGGKVEGAWLSGRALALALAASHMPIPQNAGGGLHQYK